MSVDPRTGEWTFEGVQRTIMIDIDEALGPTQREQLRALGEEGEALWIVQRNLLDYARVVEVELAKADLQTEAGLMRARALQVQHQAIVWQHGLWKQLLSLPAKPKEKEEGPS
jgi:hypothetical protein